MTLPVISPTGAMASGAYVDYMLGYVNSAETSIDTDLALYWGDHSIDDWYSQWKRITSDLSADLTTMDTDLTKIKAQIRMVSDAISKL